MKYNQKRICVFLQNKENICAVSYTTCKNSLDFLLALKSHKYYLEILCHMSLTVCDLAWYMIVIIIITKKEANTDIYLIKKYIVVIYKMSCFGSNLKIKFLYTLNSTFMNEF